jgi:predicted MFS family arabinose efflux permease
MEFGGQAIWLVLLTLGVVVLAGAMIYGIMRNRQRTLSERVMTEVETKREYEREDRDAR